MMFQQCAKVTCGARCYYIEFLYSHIIVLLTRAFIDGLFELRLKSDSISLFFQNLAKACTQDFRHTFLVLIYCYFVTEIHDICVAKCEYLRA